MDNQEAAKAFLDSFADQVKADLPGPDEYTTGTFVAEMAKRGLTITRTVAERMMKDWPCRMGRAADGHAARIYKAPV